MATAYERYNLHTTPEKFFIEACDEGADAVLAIDRVSNEMTLTGEVFERFERLCITDSWLKRMCTEARLSFHHL
ncbi:Phosphatidylinositide phosphatase SAC1-A [Larimichthys crocea]|uniref:Uncharacterized protein n=1 Tax=Larimichthys crocea TaxID=215358 RepID=A0ACD3RH10_LARCR|nr:Phosphatidylinositide phosphatase SAC1-A [Larimichthys crocea]